MANATKYVDNVNGNNGNTGNSEAQAYADIPTAVAAISGGGNIIYIQAGSNYVLTSAVTITALTGDTTNGPNRIEGYTTTPGARDGRPVITSSTNSINLFDLSGTSVGLRFVHLKGTHTAATRAAFIVTSGATGSTKVTIEDCLVNGCSYMLNASVRVIAGLGIYNSTAKNCTTGVIINGGDGASPEVISGCLFHDNAGVSYSANNNNTIMLFVNSVFSGGSKAISDGGAGSARAVHLSLINCSFNGLSSSAITQENSASLWTIGANFNNIFYSIGGYVWSLLDAANDTLVRSYTAGTNNFTGALTSGYQNNFINAIGTVSLSADPFTDSANGDFSLNNDAGGGADCRSAGFPGAYPDGETTGYMSGGAVQLNTAADYPATGDVRDGVDFNFGTLTGTLILPDTSSVLVGVDYGDAAEFSGTYAPTLQGDVRTGVFYGSSSGEEGHLIVPLPENVRSGTLYGSDIIDPGPFEFTGTLAVGGGGGGMNGGMQRT